MRQADAAQPVCQYRDPSKHGRICGKPVGRGRSKYCSKRHAELARAGKRKARGATDTRRWRRRNQSLDRLRNFLWGFVDGVQPLLGRPRSVLLWKLQKAFGDQAVGPDRREFAHFMLNPQGDIIAKPGAHTLHAYVVYENDDGNISLYAKAYSDTTLPTPAETIELGPNLPPAVVSYLRELPRCLRGQVYQPHIHVELALPCWNHKDSKHYEGRFRSVPLLPIFRGENPQRGLRLWRMIVGTRLWPGLRQATEKTLTQ